MVIARIKYVCGLNYVYYSKFLRNFVEIEFSFLLMLAAISRSAPIHCTIWHLFMKINAYTDHLGKKSCATAQLNAAPKVCMPTGVAELISAIFCLFTQQYPVG